MIDKFFLLSLLYIAYSNALKLSSGRAIELKYAESSIELRSSITRYEYKKKGQTSSLAEIDLYSMLHIGEKKYFDEIEKRMDDYDIILYELITDDSNTALDDNIKHRRYLTREVNSIKANDLANQFGFSTQLEMNMMASNWYIADLDAITVGNMEEKRKFLTFQKYWISLFGGRAASERLSMKNFYLADNVFITFLRLLSWLTPCPELGMLVVDWSRVYPKAGGLPLTLGPIIDSILSGDIINARKLAFSQQMLSGLPDSGSWGGQAMSDIEVRIKARNRKCLDTLQDFLTEIASEKTEKSDKIEESQIQEKPKKIAILYGAYHIQSLSSGLSEMGLNRIPGSDQSLPAWTMKGIQSQPQPQYESTGLISMNKRDNIDNTYTTMDSLSNVINSRTAISLLAIVPFYLAIGAFDWWALVKLGIDGVETYFDVVFNTTKPSDFDAGPTIIFGFFYFIAYIQRHVSILNTLSKSFVAWESGLFEDLLETEAK